jgi:amino acid permease
VAVGWRLRSYLRPFGGNPPRNGWWLLLAVVVGGLLIAAPNGVQLATVSLLAGFLLACSVVVGRRQLGVHRRS